MSSTPESTRDARWHTNDYLVRVLRGGVIDGTADESAPVAGPNELAAVIGSADRHERLSVQRSSAFDTSVLVGFAGQLGSDWAMDAVVGRITDHKHSHQSFGAAAQRSMLQGQRVSPVREVPLDSLATFAEALAERDDNGDTERAVLATIAEGITAGRPFTKKLLAPLVERLVQLGDVEAATTLMPEITDRNWVRHVLATELEHPRFGGTYEAMLTRLNEPYRRYGFEEVALLDGDADEAFDRLTADASPVDHEDALISVILVTSRPGAADLTVVRSVIEQTYGTWELIVIDDGSPAEFTATLDAIEALDARIRVVRGDEPVGFATRLNEAVSLAGGQFIALQGAQSWSHPRRLEVQLQDLTVNVGHLANLVHASPVTSDLSFVAHRGQRKYPANESLMFRRDLVIDTIGLFASGASSPETEFVRRLAAASGVAVAPLFSGFPLQLRRIDADHPPVEVESPSTRRTGERFLSGSTAYRWIKRIADGEIDPRADYPASARSHEDVDILVVLDGREAPSRAAFLASVTEELGAAAEAGLTVAVLQSDALNGPRAEGRFPAELQDLIDGGTVGAIVDDEKISARVVIVRHAGAAQGYAARRRPVATARVVIVDDPSSGDLRGRTFARGDVTDTIRGWFGVEPSWVSSLPAVPGASVSTFMNDREGIRLGLTTAEPREVASVQLVHESGQGIVLTPSVTGTESIMAVGGPQELAAGEWTVLIDYGSGEGSSVSARADIPVGVSVLNSPTSIVVRTENGRLRVLGANASNDLLGRGAFADEYLLARAASVQVADGSVDVAIDEGDGASVIGLYAVREVDDAVVRRRDFTMTQTAQGGRVWRRPLTKFAESRWTLFATYRTPLGAVEYPVVIDAATRFGGNDAWLPRLTQAGLLLVAPPTPGRLAAAFQRGAGVVDKTFSGLAPARLKKGGAARSSQQIVSAFEPRHSLARVEAQPIVSVVMPVYNVEPYLDAAISAVLQQDRQDIELIVVDDASSDEGHRIISRHWAADPRVRVFALDHNTLGGAGIPSNIGIRAARGKYVAFADSDDVLTQSGLAALVKAAEATDSDLAIGDFRTFTDKVKEGTEAYDRAVWEAIPLGTPISASTNPDLFRLSPVPWRKLYRRDFLESNGILYPEGDYFYEDNPLHWFVLSRARRVVVVDEVISWHRMEREGQTMSAQAYKLGAFVNHMNSILNFISSDQTSGRNTVFESFFGYLDRTHWTVRNQTQPAAAALVRRGFGNVYKRALEAAPGATVPAKARPRLATYASAYPDIDLTVVIPVFNSSDLIRGTLDSVLKITGMKFNVLVVDDGSTDDSLTIAQEYEARHDNVHVFSQGNRGAGRARNSVIPLCTGRFTYFLDADDVIDARALVKAVRAADAGASDLMFMKYRIEHIDEKRTRGMYDADVEIWNRLHQSTSEAERQQLVAGLINYPWNRIIRTSLLHDANIFFGATVVHNDVLFHWHSIVAARRIGFVDDEVCSHRKFATRSQVTSINDGRRMAVLEALRSTHTRIRDLEDYDNIRTEWIAFAEHLMEWAKSRIPDALQTVYSKRCAALEQAFDSDTQVRDVARR